MHIFADSCSQPACKHEYCVLQSVDQDGLFLFRLASLGLVMEQRLSYVKGCWTGLLSAQSEYLCQVQAIPDVHLYLSTVPSSQVFVSWRCILLCGCRRPPPSLPLLSHSVCDAAAALCCINLFHVRHPGQDSRRRLRGLHITGSRSVGEEQWLGI